MKASVCSVGAQIPRSCSRPFVLVHISGPDGVCLIDFHCRCRLGCWVFSGCFISFISIHSLLAPLSCFAPCSSLWQRDNWISQQVEFAGSQENLVPTAEPLRPGKTLQREPWEQIVNTVSVKTTKLNKQNGKTTHYSYDWKGNSLLPSCMGLSLKNKFKDGWHPGTV